MEPTPDAHRAAPAGGLRHRGRRLGSAAVTALLLVLTAAPAHAEVTRADVGDAEADAEEARRLLHAAERELAEAVRQRDRIAASVERIAEQIASQELDLGAGRAEARDRIASMYMRAGSREGLIVFAGRRISDLPAQAAYLGALADQDRELIGRLAATRADLERLSEQVRGTLGEQENAVSDATALVERRRSEYGEAVAQAEELEARWQQQEDERRRREEEERRRREEEERRRREEEERLRQEAEEALAAAAAAATAAGWTPGAGVEPWRPLVQVHFPERLVEEALRVMRCESGGNPLNVNPYSGASGLFQHMPYYWPARAEKAGWAGADIFDPEANIAVSAWLVLRSEREGKGSWAHWTCKP